MNELVSEKKKEIEEAKNTKKKLKFNTLQLYEVEERESERERESCSNYLLC